MIPLPAWIDPDAWQGFCDMRRAMPKTRPFTERAAKLILKELYKLHEAGHDANACLDQSTMRGWADVYCVKDKPIEQVQSAKVDAEIARRKAEDAEQARRSQSPEAHEARKRAMEALGIRPKLRSVG